MSDKLKPCPFCGGMAHLQAEGEHGGFQCYVCCLQCHCAVGESYDPDGMPAHKFRERDDAIAAWNTRAETSVEQAAKEMSFCLATHLDLHHNGECVCADCRADRKAYKSYRTLSGATEAKTERTGEEKR